MELSNYFSNQDLNEINSALSPEQIKRLEDSFELIDTYTDASSYDEVLGEWMDEQGYTDGIDQVVTSYENLLAKLKDQNLVTIPPYTAVENILKLLTPLSSKSSELSEATTEHDNEPRPSRMERPDISDVPSSAWSGFYIGDQLESILIDKYGTERGEKTFNGLLDTGNNAIYKVCRDIMKEKYKMLVDMGEKPRRYDYFDVNYFNLWKAWVANKGRKAVKTGTIIPPTIKEGEILPIDSIKDQIVNLCKFSNIEDRFIQILSNDKSITIKLYATVGNVTDIITAKKAIEEMLHNYDLKVNWKFKRSGQPNEGIVTGTVSLIVPHDMSYDFSLNEESTSSLENFLNKFPDDATTWDQATDELPDMYHWMTQYLNDVREKVILMPVGRGNVKTPSEWNTKYKAAIRKALSLFDDHEKEAFYRKFQSMLR